MRRLALVSGVVLCSLTASPVLVGQSAPPPLTPFRGLIDHASRTMAGGVPGNVDGTVQAISGDGRYVTFITSDQNLVPGDDNWSSDVFLRDRTTGMTSRVSVPDGGGESNGYSWMAAISTNGRHIAFASAATNLVAADTNGFADVFVRDLDAARTVRVSGATGGTQADGDAYAPSISADGRFVAFLSGVQYGPTQVYVHDRDGDGDGIFDEPGATETSRVSIGIGGAPADRGCTRVRISADGRSVMFESDATNLDPSGYSGDQHHLYVYDRQAAHTTVIDRAVSGGPSQFGVSWNSSDMSDDGRFITFTSMSPDIAPSDANGQVQVFRYDAAADPALRTTVISRGPGGVLADGWSFYTTVSGDGRYVGFLTSATTLAAPAPAGGRYAIVVADTLDGSFTRADVVDGGIGFDGQYLFNPSLSADGTAIAFLSDASNAVNGAYTNYQSHMFVVTAFSASTPPPAPQEGGAGSIDVNTLAVSGWDASVQSFDDWIVLTGGAEYAAGPRTLYYLVSPNPSGILRTGRIRVGSTFVTIRQAGDGDTTPPVITPIVTGTQGGDGWYTSNVTVSWTVGDPESEIVNQIYNCTNTITLTTDAIYAPVTCEATSHGGTASQTVVIRRDTTAPTISITQPAATIYQSVAAMPSFSCDDPYGYSGVATCVGSTPQNEWLDMSPGRHVFTVTATDRAGNSSTRSVEYIAGPQACVTPSFLTARLARWWKFDGNLRESITRTDSALNVGAATFQASVAQQGWYDSSSGNFLNGGQASATIAASGLTVAAWVRPNGQYGSYGTIVSNPLQYHIARYPDGTLRWAFNTTAGFDWVNTGAQLATNVWSHVAVTYTSGHVRSYVNGRLVHDAALSGTLTTSGSPLASMTVGGRDGVMATLVGTLDDLMIFGDALPATEVDGLALAGSGSLCTPLTSSLTLTTPGTIVYGSTFQVSVWLTDTSGRALPNRNITITSAVTPGYVNDRVTDANGRVTAQFPIDSSMTVGVYMDAITVTFAGDGVFDAATLRGSVTLVGGTPPVAWAAPVPIAYGTPLGAAQLNATSTLAGTFTYSPAVGTVLAAGTHTLTATFTPADTARWTERVETRTIVVNKATPAIAWPTPAGIVYGTALGAAQLNASTSVDGTFAYSPAAGTVLNAGSRTLSVTFTPADASSYNTATASVTLNVAKATPAIAWPNPAGIVYGTPLGAAQLNAAASVDGTFAYSPAAGTVLGAGVHVLSATFTPSDPANHNGATESRQLTVAQAPLQIRANDVSKPFGAPLPPLSATPDGFVNGDSMASLNGSLIVSTAATATSPAGSYVITASGVSSPNYAIIFQNGTVAVAPASTVTSVAASPNPVGLDQPLTLTASIAVVAPGAGTPAGSVTFFDGGTPLGAVALSGGTASLTTNGLAAGSHSVSALYSGDGNFATSVANGAFTVKTSSASSTTAVTSSTNPSSVGQTITLTATVTAPGGLSGSVVFYDGATLVGTATISGTIARLFNVSLAAGGHAITARYLGNATIPPSVSPALAQYVRLSGSTRTSTVALVASPSSPAAGSTVTFTATVTGSQNRAPSGVVLFMVNGFVLGQGTLTQTGNVTATVPLPTALPHGVHRVEAVYLGDTTFRASKTLISLVVN
jgi:Concanavalin A-like lectin/glucanases superfamily/Bacterial Ig-like domain (group 3)/MBG domain (YGX type)/WD40-like Beta Propeller Repeat